MFFFNKKNINFIYQIIFWVGLFILYCSITYIIYFHRINHIFTQYGMPDIDTDGGLWYQWMSIYVHKGKLLPDILDVIAFPFGYDITIQPFSNLIYSIQIFFLEHILGFTWQNLIFITNLSSLVTYPLSALGGSLLCYYLIRSKTASILAGTVFGFSFYHVFMGRGEMSINHIELIPFYFLSLFYFLNKKTFPSLILSSLIFGLLFKADPYYAFFSGIFSVVIFLFYKKEKILVKVKSGFIYYATVSLFLLLINFFFVLSNIFLLNHTAAVTIGRNSSPRGELTNILFYFVPSPENILYKYGLLGAIIFSITFIIAIIGGIVYRKNRLYFTLFLCFLLGVVLTTYIPVFYGINLIYFKFFGIFRSVGRMILPTYLFLGLMVGMSTVHFKRYLSKKTFIFIFLLLFFSAIVSGLSNDSTWLKNTDFSKTYNLYKPIRENKDIHVISPYPMTVGEGSLYCPQTYQLISQIITEKKFSCGANPFDPIANTYYRSISDISKQNTIDELTNYGVDTIIIYNKLLDNSGKVNSILKHDSRLSFVGRYTQSEDGGYVSNIDKSRDVSVYQIKKVVEKNRAPLPLFYLLADNKKTPIKFEKVSPYKYVIYLDQLSRKKGVLIYNAPYSAKWNMFEGNLSNLNDALFFFKQPMQNNARYDDYLNSWRLNADNPNKVTIFFDSRKYSYLGKIVSMLTLIVSSLYIGFKIIYDKYKR